MKQQSFTSKLARAALVVGIAGIFAPVAHAQGGAVSHVYASPPLDAGSSVPNPDYVQKVRTGPTRPDDRANRASLQGTDAAIVAQSAGDSFDWSDAGIGAAGAVAVLLVAAGSGVGIQRTRQRTASA